MSSFRNKKGQSSLRLGSFPAPLPSLFTPGRAVVLVGRPCRLSRLLLLKIKASTSGSCAQSNLLNLLTHPSPAAVSCEPDIKTRNRSVFSAGLEQSVHRRSEVRRGGPLKAKGKTSLFLFPSLNVCLSPWPRRLMEIPLLVIEGRIRRKGGAGALLHPPDACNRINCLC